MTSGVSEGLDLALRALLNPGDEVIVPEPSYVAYQPCVAFAGGVAVPVASDPAQGYRLDAARIAEAVTPRTKAVLFGSPSNPTGAAQSAADLTALVALAEREDFWLVSDEIYDRLTYTGTHTSTAAVPGRLGPDGRAQRLLEVLRDDRLAGRLRLRARSRWRR